MNKYELYIDLAHDEIKMKKKKNKKKLFLVVFKHYIFNLIVAKKHNVFF